MDINKLKQDLGAVGTVDYCGFNGDNEDKIIIKIHGFTPSASNIRQLYSIISINNPENEFSSFENVNISGESVVLVLQK